MIFFYCRCVISKDLFICHAGKQLHSVKFSLKDAKVFSLELNQQIANIQSVKSAEKSGVYVEFSGTGSEQSHQVVLLSEQGQSSVKCKLMPSAAHWVLSDPTHETDFVVQLSLINKVSLFFKCFSKCTSFA